MQRPLGSSRLSPCPTRHPGIGNACVRRGSDLFGSGFGTRGNPALPRRCGVNACVSSRTQPKPRLPVLPRRPRSSSTAGDDATRASGQRPARGVAGDGRQGLDVAQKQGLPGLRSAGAGQPRRGRPRPAPGAWPHLNWRPRPPCGRECSTDADQALAQVAAVAPGLADSARRGADDAGLKPRRRRRAVPARARASRTARRPTAGLPARSR